MSDATKILSNKPLSLGQPTDYIDQYDPSLLCAIPRAGKREELGISDLPPFFGFDAWTHYEVSWLNAKGKPMVAIVKMLYDCHSPNIVESKSLKLYYNSFNQTYYETEAAIKACIQRDLSACVGGAVDVSFMPVATQQTAHGFAGECIDALDVACTHFSVTPTLLQTGKLWVSEILYSDLLKSNCLVTHQPDWASVQISYTGKQIQRESLLQYLVSFRQHNEFHEQCIERIFMDLKQYCQPQDLTVYGRYTRRGGIDINPYRSTQNDGAIIKNLASIRLPRQ